MNLEDQVCSLELSKKLKELGIKQESLFTWYIYNDNYIVRFIDWSPEISGQMPYSAFTASELISLLPHRITLKEGEPFNSFRLRIEKSFIITNTEMDMTKPFQPIPRDIYIINYYCDTTECEGENAWLQRQLFPHNIWDENFCNALAKTLIKIYENKYVL